MFYNCKGNGGRSEIHYHLRRLFKDYITFLMSAVSAVTAIVFNF